MPPFEKHIFVCTNRRAPDNPKGSCAEVGGEALFARFKKEVFERGLGERFRANQAGCLDACEHGCAVVVYPDNVWYARVTEDDVREIIESHLVDGQPVARLLATFAPRTKPSSAP